MQTDFLLLDSEIVVEKDISRLHGTFAPYGLSILFHALIDAGYIGRLILNRTAYTEILKNAAEFSRTIKLIGHRFNDHYSI
ncbi:MAG: hypothetical protein L6437_02410 [Kiritimatiellae bacterium]|nr:hypothetical protein [Kiritimatiellia bacterium]